ncbi:MAG: hydantoinase/oxoprolinase family protein [Candidatus Tectomicrobia bacterium]|uniref:Hydantoinase/oxoprolinase family protein n=1 Tax=Tectimicrobiota bacterium TaxID=2528274 RepID=A0A932CQK2_UNCTE|nr:hydantoinase/oxoprolinase family protein [Candidatus Tectomicrobia bacterium]
MIGTAQEKGYLVALDAGGTMTDTFLVDESGNFYLGKHLTCHEDESVSYLGSVQDACASLGISSTEMHGKAIASIYTGTTILNTLLQRTGTKVGLLITRGFEHLSYMERGLTWLGQSPYEISKFQLHEHTAPLVDLQRVKPISERISGGSFFPPGCHHPAGQVIIPLAEEEVRRAVNELLEVGVETIGILFLHSYANPEHERRAAEVAREVLRQREADLPVVLSSEICPRIKESTRAKSLLLECYAAEPTRRQLLAVERAAQGEGFRYELQTVLSYGAVANVRYPRLYESICSGPTGGVLGGQFLARLLGIRNLICADIGGTSFDVGLIVEGVLPIDKEPSFARHRLNLPMVALDSIGAGAGMEIHVDPDLKRTYLGPVSAGSRLGVCLDYPEITLSDVNVALGYLPWDYFLGGKIRLDREAAWRALEERLARPLGLSVEEAGSGVLDLLHSQLRDHLHGTLRARGLNPREFALIAYGGSGPLHLWGVMEGMELGGVCTVPWAAAFSAFGIATSEYLHRYERGFVCVLAGAMSPEARLDQARMVDAAWREMEEQAYRELEREGFPRESVSFRYGISARYLGQLFASWDAPVVKGRVEGPEDAEGLIAAFEQVYTTIYPTAARFAEAGYLISSAYLEAIVPKITPKLVQYPLKDRKPPHGAYKGQREVYHRGWKRFDRWEMDRLEAGNCVEGPAILEHPMTTLVVPPEHSVEFDAHKVIWYRRK